LVLMLNFYEAHSSENQWFSNDITFRLDSSAYIDRVLLAVQLRQILSGAKWIDNCHYLQVIKGRTCRTPFLLAVLPHFDPGEISDLISF